MSQSQYKMGKAMSTLRKIRRLLLIQQRHIYKKCLLGIHINNIDLSLLGNNAPFKLWLHHHNSLFYKQIKSYVEMRIIQYCKLYNQNMSAYFHKWKIKNSRAIEFLIDVVSKVDSLYKIDKTMVLVYMATIGRDSGMMPNISKPYEKTATWGN